MKPPCVTIDVDGEIKAFKIDDDAVLVFRKVLFEYSVTMNSLKLPPGVFVVLKLPRAARKIIGCSVQNRKIPPIEVVLDEDWKMLVSADNCRWDYMGRPIYCAKT